MKCHYVGVDVGAKELVVSIDRNGTRESGIVFTNDSVGHRTLIRWATKKGATARVVLESTGVYGLDLAFALHRAKRVEVMVANPRAISAFAKRSSVGCRDREERSSALHSRSVCICRP